ncbi:hypothetical protein LINPERHAP2_LOCUS39553 [Linum perenne]
MVALEEARNSCNERKRRRKEDKEESRVKPLATVVMKEETTADCLTGESNSRMHMEIWNEISWRSSDLGIWS